LKTLTTLVCLIAAAPSWAADSLIEARDTISGFEMDRGDTVRYKLRNGQVRTLVLEDSSAKILLTNLQVPRKAQPDGGTLYEMRARLRIDGYPVTLIRYVGSQETFAVPYVINGMRLWLDVVRESLALMTDNHGGNAGCAMSKAVRLAANDARDAIAPVPLRHWYPMKRPFLDIAESYNGDDPYFGAYQGAECHAGLDINHPKGEPLFAPVDIDDHYFFNSLAKGDNNNRWRGIHRWPNGETWTLQAHHLVSLLIPEHQPFRAGAPYAAAAGVLPGSNEHSHFIFKTRPPGAVDDIPLDPWILFWQICEQDREAAGDVRARIQPFAPAKTGSPVRFSSEASRKGRFGVRLDTGWTFGDGGFSAEPAPVHVFARAGVYPVTLTVWDGVDRAAVTHLITVDGAAVSKPVLILTAPEETGFVARRAEVRDTYGVPPSTEPHTIRIVTRLKDSPARPREIIPADARGGRLPRLLAPTIRYRTGNNWLSMSMAAGDTQRIRVEMNPKGLTPGIYEATVSVDCPGCLNSPQQFRVVLDIRQTRPGTDVTVDDADPGFYATPYFWVGHRFRFWKHKGYRGFYRSNGARAQEGEFVRFTPDLRAGRYEVSFADETPFPADSAFQVAIRHRGGIHRAEAEPGRSRVLGTFDFAEGCDGYVQLNASGSRGQVLADAIRFQAVKEK
jgi:hypothetical protein